MTPPDDKSLAGFTDRAELERWIIGRLEHRGLLGSPQRLYSGTGSPENVVAATIGAIYVDEAGGIGSTLYVKEAGSGDTGWAAK